MDHKIKTLCVSGHPKNHKTDCWIQWTNLTDNNVGRTVVTSDWFHYCVMILLFKLLRVSQLTVIIILIIK